MLEEVHLFGSESGVLDEGEEEEEEERKEEGCGEDDGTYSGLTDKMVTRLKANKHESCKCRCLLLGKCEKVDSAPSLPLH